MVNRKIKILIDGKTHIGGAPFNVAAHTTECGAGASIVSYVGNDQLGTEALSLVSRFGIDSSFIRIDKEHCTGKVDVTLSVDNIPVFDICRNSAYDYIHFEQQDVFAAWEQHWDVFYFGTLAQHNEVSRKTLKLFLDNFHGMIFYDINLRQNFFSREIIEESLRYASILKLNQDEVASLSNMLYNENFPQEKFCACLCRDLSLETVIITLGENSCEIFSDNKMYKIPAVKAEVVDTVGAGDAFSAAFICSRLVGNDIVLSASEAVKLAAFVVGHNGAVPEN